MLIGSLHISTENYTYQIANFTNCSKHPFFSHMIDLFPVKPTYNIPGDQLYCSDSIVPLSEFIQTNSFTIQTATKLLYSIYYQIQVLHEHHIAISFIDIHDVMVIDDTHFYFCNCDKLYAVKKNNRIVITDFYDILNPFLPPEFKKNTIMPFSTFSTSSYYSLAIVIIYCLHNHKIKEPSVVLSKDPHQLGQWQYDILQRYRHTKLYHTLLSCLINEPKERNPILF